MVDQIPDDVLDAIRPHVLPAGATTAVGVGPAGGRLRLDAAGERARIRSALELLSLVERIKDANHNIYVRNKAMDAAKAFLVSIGA